MDRGFQPGLLPGVAEGDTTRSQNVIRGFEVVGEMAYRSIQIRKPSTSFFSFKDFIFI